MQFYFQIHINSTNMYIGRIDGPALKKHTAFESHFPSHRIVMIYYTYFRKIRFHLNRIYFNGSC